MGETGWVHEIKQGNQTFDLIASLFVNRAGYADQ
jgi:hypothetical protein